MDWINGILQGALIGGLYALFAAGLSLMFGVMRLVNIAHGDLIVFAAYLGLVVVQTLGLSPFVSLVIVVPTMFVLGGDILPPLLVTFGLSIIIQNALLEGFSADSQKLQAGNFETASLHISDQLAIGWFPFVIFLTAVAVIALLELLIYRTALGRAFRATSDDADTARLYGVRNRHVYALATALSLAVISIAAIFLAVRVNFDPASGPARLLYAFEAVIIGGLGSLWGTLAGGVVLGVAQAVGAQLNPGWESLAGHLAFLAVLILRPRGLFPKLVD